MPEKVIAIDFETFYSKDYGIQSHGLHGYTHHEQFDPYMISASDGETSWAGEPADFDWSCLEGATVLAHNAAFDRTVYEAMVEQGLAPRVNIKIWHCTANMTSYLCNRRSLADSVKHLLHIDVDKTMRNYMKGKTWADAKADGNNAAKLLEYARLDAKHCHDLWTKFSHKWPQHERDLAQMTMDQCTRGVQIDVKLLHFFIATAQDSMIAIEKSIPWLETGGKPTSPKSIAEQCRKNGIPSPPIKSHEDGEEKFAHWEETYGEKYDWVKSVSNWRVMNKFLGTVERMKNWLRPDGTMTFSLKYFGAHTGRWSGDAGLNMQNFRRVPIHVDLETKLICEAADTSIALDIRSLFLPRPGKKMVICDLSQIEPRVLAWLSGDYELLEEIKGGMAIYEVHARKSLGWKGGKLKFEDPGLYTRAKAEVLALGYGCGAERYVDAAWTLARYKVDPEDAVNEVNSFRENNPKIVALWRRLDNAFKKNVGGTYEIGLPSGRDMRYPQIRTEARRYRNKETGKMKVKSVFTADVGGRHKPHYGGLLAENADQALSRDVFGWMLLKILLIPSIKILWTTHDEGIFECDNESDLQIILDIMSTTPPWLEGCPIACEGEEVKCYKK